MGDHGFDHNELGYYDESFRIPFALLWSKLEPRRITDPAGQIDIAPTLLDLLGIPMGTHHFQGRSILSDPPQPVLFVQPYNGTWLGLVDGPKRYLKRERTGEELVFDLDSDPGENEDLSDATPKAQLDAWRQAVDTLWLTQHLMRNDQVLPP